LVNGNTFITKRDFMEMMEMNPEGQSVGVYNFKHNFDLNRGWEPQRLRNRRFFSRVKRWHGPIEELVECDPFNGRGHVLHWLPLPVKQDAHYTVEPLPNGHY